MEADNDNQNSESGRSESKGPVGQGDYVVGKGECISSIAYEHGCFWETLWNYPDNNELKQTRKNPNVLLEGDRLTIPPIRVQEENGSTEQRHRFKAKGVPIDLRIRLLFDGEPRKNKDYRLVIDNMLILQGTTDSDGVLQESIPPNSEEGQLLLLPEQQEYLLQLRHLDPIEEITGIQARLNNLGFDCGPVDGKAGPKTKAAVTAFQHENGLTVDGVAGPQTQAKLKAVYGC